MREQRASTALRVAGLYSLSFAIVSALVGAATWLFTDGELRRSLDERLHSELIALEHADRAEGREALIGDILAFDAMPGNGRYLLNAPDGTRLAGKVSVSQVSDGIHDAVLVHDNGQSETVRLDALTLPDGATLAVVGELGLMRRTELTLLGIAGGGFGVVIIIGVVGAVLTGRVLQHRLAQVDGTARAIIAGDFSRRMPISSNCDEFDQLSHTLNRMLDHIERLMGSLRQVSADIAHDLRSPLCRLRARLEQALPETQDPAYRATIADALERIDDILALFATILRICEVEAGGVRRQFAAISMAPLIAEIVEDYLPSAQDGGHTLTTGALVETNVFGSRDLLAQATSNLIENALNHTPAGTRIEVNLLRTVEGIVLEVRDDGPGIPQDMSEVARQRFGRLDASRSTPGHGLGLTMVESVALAHEGRLELADAHPGLVARLHLGKEV
ncbi:sensor histidine kinase [Croceibacterium salegens]|nr:HAMP domain-containing sensor histidine kinase [Croceibacterium salegens]